MQAVQNNSCSFPFYILYLKLLEIIYFRKENLYICQHFILLLIVNISYLLQDSGVIPDLILLFLDDYVFDTLIWWIIILYNINFILWLFLNMSYTNYPSLHRVKIIVSVYLRSCFLAFRSQEIVKWHITAQSHSRKYIVKPTSKYCDDHLCKSSNGL